MKVSFSEICRNPDDDQSLPFLDREQVPDNLSEHQKLWREQGFLILPNFIPDNLIDHYCELRERLTKPGGWTIPTPYMSYSQLRDICLYRPLMEKLEELIGEEMGLHLNLTGWISTERNFHQDDYLNPTFVRSHYAATWMALDDIHPDSGPFEYVPGSNRWPCIAQDKVVALMKQHQGIDLSDPSWPSKTEGWVAEACEEEIERRGAKVKQFLPKKGDLLIWHGRLIHRGSRPKVPGLQRKALISHYSALSKRQDMPHYTLHEHQGFDSKGYYFVLKNNPMPASEKIAV